MCGATNRLFLLLPLLNEKNSAHDLVRRIRLNHTRAKFEEALIWAFFRVENRRLRYVHFPRRLSPGLFRFLAEAHCEDSQIYLLEPLFRRHSETLLNICNLNTFLLAMLGSFLA